MNLRSWLLVLPLVGAVFGYARTLRGDFVLDDLGSVVRDPTARDLEVSTHALLPSLFSAGQSLPAEATTKAHLGNFRAIGLEGGRGVVAWTLAVNHAIGGLNPVGYHMLNLGLHLGVTLLVFFFVRVLLRRASASNPDDLALVVAGIFALHPLNSQAVNYVTQRAEVIASGAYLGSLWLLLRASTVRSRLSTAFLLLSALAVFALGLGTQVIRWPYR